MQRKKTTKDTSWELAAGVRETGLNNFTQALGLRAQEVVTRLNSDKGFATVVAQNLIALYDGAPPQPQPGNMDTVKRLMGGRCFLAEEVQSFLSLQHREYVDIPKLTGKQIEQLMTFLRGPCPILGNIPAAQTHILFPQPSTIGGATFGTKWIAEKGGKVWDTEISISGNKIADPFFSKVRDPHWFLMFWNSKEEAAVPHGTDVGKLSEIGYSKPDFAIYALGLGYLKQRGTNLASDMRGRYEAGIAYDLYVTRTSRGGLSVYPGDKEPALIRKVPLQ